MTATCIAWLVLASMATAVAAQAQEISSGELFFSMNADAVCSAVTPGGSLQLPFNAALALTGQTTSAPVTVTVSCSGEPTINHVDFDPGQNSTAGTTAPRYLKDVNVNGSAAADDLLGYRLWARAGTGASSTDIVNTGQEIEREVAGNANRLTFPGGSSELAYQVVGRISETAARTGAFGNPSLPEAAAAVPAGSYSDTIVMTVTYSQAAPPS